MVKKNNFYDMSNKQTIKGFFYKGNKKGFTLIEIMVVVVIIILLTTFTAIAIDNARKRTRDAIIISSLEQLHALAKTVYDPINEYKEFYYMREKKDSRIEEIRKRIIDMGGSGFNFNIYFPEDVSGEEGYYEYCAWVKLFKQPLNGPERNFCIDSRGVIRIVDWKWGEVGYNCRMDALPKNCDSL